jgi:UMF1 family MFS transporter
MSLPSAVKRWAFYDFANSSYVLIFQSFLLPVYFSTILVQHGYSLSTWGLANGISTFVGVLLSVVVGNYADKHNRIVAFKWTVAGSFLGMCVLSFAVKFFPGYVFHLYVLTNTLFIVTLSLSDSILPYLASEEEAFRYSGFAWGFGYLGGIASMIVVVILQRVSGDYSPLAFFSVAVFYIIFSIYAMAGLKNLPLNQPQVSDRTVLRISKGHKVILLIGYWLISECITVIILFYSIYAATELGLSTFVIGVTLLLVQLIGFFATWGGGWLTTRHNSLLLLGITILFWGVVIALLYFNLGMPGLVLIVIFTGLVIGNSQSYLRAQYSTLIDKSESGFQFGIYSFISQAAVFIGPVIYGFASDRLKSQRIPLLALFVFMLIGYVLVRIIIHQIKDTPQEQAAPF